MSMYRSRLPASRVIRHVNEPTVGGRKDISGLRFRGIATLVIRVSVAVSITATSPEFWCTTKTRPPSGVTVISCGPGCPVGIVAVTIRFTVSMTETVLLPVLETYAFSPSGVMASRTGAYADGNRGRDLVGSGIDHSNGI